MRSSKSEAKPVPIAESPHRRMTDVVAFSHEIATIYPYHNDRFVVSLIFGYSKQDGGITTPKQAAKTALDYVRKETDGGTVWHVFDRMTGELFALEEREFVNEPEPFAPLSATEDQRVLWAHCVSEHATILSPETSLAELHDFHTHEHEGPGTIRNHDPASRVYSLKKMGKVLYESER